MRIGRGLLAFGVALNLFTMFTHELGSRLWWLGFVMLWLGLCAWATVEWAAHRAQERHEELQWELAAASGDPIGSLAVMSYVDGLTERQRDELRRWLLDGVGKGDRSVDLDAVPPVVEGLILAALRTPRDPHREG